MQFLKYVFFCFYVQKEALLCLSVLKYQQDYQLCLFIY